VWKIIGKKRKLDPLRDHSRKKETFPSSRAVERELKKEKKVTLKGEGVYLKESRRRRGNFPRFCNEFTAQTVGGTKGKEPMARGGRRGVQRAYLRGGRSRKNMRLPPSKGEDRAPQEAKKKFNGRELCYAL